MQRVPSKRDKELAIKRKALTQQTKVNTIKRNFDRGTLERRSIYLRNRQDSLLTSAENPSLLHDPLGTYTLFAKVDKIENRGSFEARNNPLDVEIACMRYLNAVPPPANMDVYYRFDGTRTPSIDGVWLTGKRYTGMDVKLTKGAREFADGWFIEIRTSRRQVDALKKYSGFFCLCRKTPQLGRNSFKVGAVHVNDLSHSHI